MQRACIRACIEFEWSAFMHFEVIAASWTPVVSGMLFLIWTVYGGGS